eukprot:3015478-Alexandrium_andersonii.AAC.1
MGQTSYDSDTPSFDKRGEGAEIPYGLTFTPPLFWTSGGNRCRFRRRHRTQREKWCRMHPSGASVTNLEAAPGPA